MNSVFFTTFMTHWRCTDFLVVMSCWSWLKILASYSCQQETAFAVVALFTKHLIMDGTGRWCSCGFWGRVGRVGWNKVLLPCIVPTGYWCYDVFFQHARDATHYSFSSNSQHALDATLFCFSIDFQQALDATIYSFATYFQHALDSRCCAFVFLK